MPDPKTTALESQVLHLVKLLEKHTKDGDWRKTAAAAILLTQTCDELTGDRRLDDIEAKHQELLDHMADAQRSLKMKSYEGAISCLQAAAIACEELWEMESKK